MSVNLSSTLTYKEDQVIYKENDFADGLYIVESGKILTLKKSSENRLIPVGEVISKGFLGIEGLLSFKKRCNSAVCLERTTLIKVKIEDMEKFFSLAPDWQKKLFTTMSERLSKSKEVIAENRIISEKFWQDGDFSPEIETKYKKLLNL